MFEMEQIGRRIAALRKNSNMTQQDLADRLGVTYQAVSNWERGLSVPDVLRLKDIAQLFEVTLDDLMGNQKDARLVKVAAGEEKPESIRELTQSAPYMKPRDLEEELLDQIGLKDQAAPPKSGQPTTQAPADEPEAAEDNETPSDEEAGSADLTLDDLAAMAPFVSPEVLVQVARRLLETGSLSDIGPLHALAPFLDPEGLLALCQEALDQGLSIGPDFLSAAAPFLDPEGLEAIADRLLADGSPFSLEELTRLAPFMDGDALGKLALRLAASGRGRTEDLLRLAPFLESADLRELIKTSPAPSRDLIRSLLPFLDPSDMEELILKTLRRD